MLASTLPAPLNRGRSNVVPQTAPGSDVSLRPRPAAHEIKARIGQCKDCGLKVTAKNRMGMHFAHHKATEHLKWRSSCRGGKAGGLLSGQQFGARRGHDCSSPLGVATLLCEQAWDEGRPMAALVQDILKAFDSVARRAGKELSLRRLAVPETVIDLFGQMDEGNRAVVGGLPCRQVSTGADAPG